MAVPTSHNEIQEALRAALPARSYIVDVWPEKLVYCSWNEGQADQHWEADYKFDDEGVAELGNPTKVTPKRIFEPVEFSAEFSEDHTEGEDIVYTGKVFEIGNYPDKNYSVTEEEADEAIRNFKPVHNDSEHRRSVFDGSLKDGRRKLGTLERVWRDGKQILGELKIPTITAAVLGDKVPVSVKWSPSGPKRIIKNALTWNPRIDGAMVAAFSKDDDDDLGQSGPNDTAQPAEKPTEVNPNMALPNSVQPATTGQPAPSADLAAVTAERDKLLKEKQEADDRRKAFEASAVDREAEAYAQKLMQDKQILTPQKELVAGAFSQCVRDDNQESGVCFSADNQLIEGPRTQALRKLIESFPKHTHADASGLHILGEFAAGANSDGEGDLPLSVDARSAVGLPPKGGN